MQDVDHQPYCPAEASTASIAPTSELGLWEMASMRGSRDLGV